MNLWEGKYHLKSAVSRNYLVKIVFQKYIDDYDLKIHPDTHTNTQTHTHTHTHTHTLLSTY